MFNTVSIAFSEVESSLSRLEKLVPESGEAPAPSHAGEVERLKQSVRLDIHDLADTLHTVEQAPHKYQLSDEELDSRRKFLDAAKRRFKVLYCIHGYSPATTGSQCDHWADLRIHLLSLRVDNYET